MYSVKFNSRCYKILKKIPKNSCTRILSKIRQLETNPVPQDAKRILNVKGKMFRIRVGFYRILYVINYEEKQVYISNIDKRERIY
ncbi:type II toxin-antitoxin system RelE/ParE family toxin [Candidatus Woesearchaeota archaeon]|nr:type II toxin-antitoxin system RelE/ParE family toxin [Candidatus Woesearchaeota archaeon]